MAANPAEVLPAEPAKVKFCDKSAEGSVCTFKFGNGTTLTFDTSTCDAEMQTDLAAHGALQKIGDSYAGANGDYEYAIASAQRIIQNLQDGNWKTQREGGTSAPRLSELAEAVAKIKGFDLARATEIVTALDEDQRKVLRGKDAVKAAIAQVRYEKAAAKASSAAPDDLSSLGI